MRLMRQSFTYFPKGGETEGTAVRLVGHVFDWKGLRTRTPD